MEKARSDCDTDISDHCSDGTSDQGRDSQDRNGHDESMIMLGFRSPRERHAQSGALRDLKHKSSPVPAV